MKHIYTCKEKKIGRIYSVKCFQDGIEIIEVFFVDKDKKNLFIKEWSIEGVRDECIRNEISYEFFSVSKELDGSYELDLYCGNYVDMSIRLMKSSLINPDMILNFWDKYGNVVISVAKDSVVEKTRMYTAIIDKIHSYFYVALLVDDEVIAVISADDRSSAKNIASCWQRYHRICIEREEIDDYGFYIPGIDEPKKEGYSDED